MLYLENENDSIVIENPYIRREITFRYGCPVHSVLIRPESGYRWEEAGNRAVLSIPGFDWEHCETTYDEESNIVTFDSNFIVRWVFSPAENAPAIRSQIFVKGHPAEENADVDLPETVTGAENAAPAKKPEREITDSVSHTGNTLKLRSVRFYDRTDACDSLVRQDDAFLYRAAEGFSGSLFFASDPGTGESCVLLKEAPVGIAHLNRTGADLYADYHHLSVSGSGIDYTALSDRHFTPGYPVTVALCRTGAEEETARALYTDACGGFAPYIMSNTWGDRSQDRAVCEEFLKEEIRCAQRLGVDIVQIDDGWQKGRSANSAIAKSDLWNGGFYDSDADFWQPDPVKFPNGFGPLCDYAYSHHVALGLWFSPDMVRHYANWQRDAETLLHFYRAFGIRHFKLDGMLIADKETEQNFIRMCFRLLTESEGRITFNMDITADRRLGYFYEKELGTLFVENRYTDWGNYYPHNTFRNLWQLSHFIPAQKLLFEVLNLRRNQQNYLLPDGTPDPLAPVQYDADYAFAVVMASNPLIWMEMQHLSEEDTERLSALIAVYRQYRDDFIEVIPRGSCPNGYSLSGFEIRGAERSYFIGVRELSPEDSMRIPVERILHTNDPELFCDNDRVVFSDTRKYFFAILRAPLNERSDMVTGGGLA